MLTEIVMAGSGGQGIQFIGQVLALAAMRQGLQATYVPSYGAERRGGPSFCSVVIADQPIYAIVFQLADVLLALDQRGWNQYSQTLKPRGIIITNKNLVTDLSGEDHHRVIEIPASQLAEQEKIVAVNLVMLGAYVTLSQIVNSELLRTMVQERSAKKPQLSAGNLQALISGEGWIKEHVR